MHLIHRCQQGFTTVTLMGVLMVGGLLVAASFAAVDPDLGLTKKDDDSKQAYAAAEAGHQLLPEPPGAGLELLHALRERAVGEPERGEPRVGRHGRRPAPVPQDPGHHVRLRGRAAGGPEHGGGGHRAVRAGHARLDDRRRRPAPSGSAPPAARAPRSTRATSRRSAASWRRCGARPSSTTSTSPTARRSTRWPTAILDRPGLGRAQLRPAAPGPAGRLHRDQLHHAGRRERPAAHERQHPGLRLAELRQRRQRRSSS